LAPSGTSLPQASHGGGQWTARRLIGAHKLVALGAVAVCALLVAMIVAAALGPKGGPVTDATSCSQWGSANWRQQTAYARRYVQEHGGVDGQTSPIAVINAINNGCMEAFGEDVDDTTSVVQAISGNF
jgi:hypothetical protein